MPTAALAQPHLVAYVLLDLAIIIVALQVGGRLAGVVGQPRVVGEIVAGILIGPTVLGGHVAFGAASGAGLVDRIYPAEAVSFLTITGQVGLVIYMFLVGLEIDQGLLRGRGRQIAALAAVLAAVPIAVGFAAAGAFDGTTWRVAGASGAAVALFLGAALATVGLPVIAHMIQERALLGTAVACVALVVGSVVTIVAFLAIGVAGAIGRDGDVAHELAVKVAWTAALIACAVAIVRPLVAWVTQRGLAETHGGPVLAGLLALALSAGAAADHVGVAPLVGGLLVGLATPASPQLARAILSRTKDVVLVFFLPVFFASSGLRTDLRLIDPSLVPGVVLFIALIAAAKWAPSYLAARATGLDVREASALGALLGSGGMLALVVGTIGLDAGLITPQMQVVVVLAALITLIPIGPLLNRLRSVS
jgi:Kef-type K+ transport system membrane component KefB